MATNRFRGDAIARAKILRLVGPGSSNPVEVLLTVGARQLTFDAWEPSDIVAGIEAAALPEFTEVAFSVDGDDVVAVGPLDDDFEIGLQYRPTVTITTDFGIDPVNQRTTLTFDGADVGTFTVTLNGETTSAVTVRDDAGLITAINALSSFTSGDVLVVDSGHDFVTLEFAGNYAATPVTVSIDPALLGNGRTVYVTETTPYSAGPHDVWGLAMMPSTTAVLRISGNDVTIRSDLTLEDMRARVQSCDTTKQINVYGGETGYSDADGIRSVFYVIDFAGFSALSRPSPSIQSVSDGACEVAIICDPTSQNYYRDATDLDDNNIGLVNHYLLDFSTGNIRVEYDGIEFDVGVPSIGSMANDLAIIQTQFRDVSEYDEAITGIGAFLDGGVDGFTAGVNLATYNGKMIHLFNVNSTLRQVSGSGQLVQLNKAGSAATGAVHEISVPSPTTATGTFALQLPEGRTAAVAGNASAGTMQTQLAGLVTGTTVSGAGTKDDPWIVTYPSGAGERPFEIPVDVGLTGHGTGGATTTRAHVNGKSQAARIAISPNATGGTVDLAFGSEGPVTITLGDSAATVDAALATLPTIANAANVNTTYDSESETYDVDFVSALADQRLPEFRVSRNNLDILNAAATSVDQAATGAGNFSDPANWSQGRLPINSDDVVFEGELPDVRYGLRQWQTVTVDTGTDVFTAAGGHDFHDNQVIRFATAGTLPTGIIAGTDYYVLDANNQYGTFRVSATSGGSAVNVTGAGSGTHYAGATCAAVRVPASFGGEIGREERTIDGVVEYRPRSLALGIVTALDVGRGDGPGASLLKFDFGYTAGTLNVHTSGAATETNVPPIVLQVNSAAADVNVYGGEVGIAYFDGDESTLQNLTQTGGLVAIGKLTATTLQRFGGRITARELSVSGLIELA
jgi:hypothetical protein